MIAHLWMKDRGFGTNYPNPQEFANSLNRSPGLKKYSKYFDNYPIAEICNSLQSGMLSQEYFKLRPLEKGGLHFSKIFFAIPSTTSSIQTIGR